MHELTIETATTAMGFVVEVVAMIGLTVIGLLAEASGVEHLQSGVDPLTVWFFVVGTVALYAGLYMVGYRTLVPRIRATGADR